MANSVSVVVPFYGTAQSQRLNLVAESVLSQKGIKLEFIVAGLNSATKIGYVSELLKCPGEEVPETTRMGAVINNGIKLATGDFTYISDADIIFPNNHYLERLVQESNLGNGTSLKRPPMKRLLIQDFDWLYSMTTSQGLNQSLGELDFTEDYVVKPIGTNRVMRVFPKIENGKEKVFIASEAEFNEYISDESNKGSEPRYFNQDRHCGAIFTPTEALVNVGGYHEGFISWGVWDADVQWKLGNETGMKLIPKEGEFGVIHLDHEKGYFSKSKWEHDRKLQEKRRALGFEACISEDIKVYSGGRNGR